MRRKREGEREGNKSAQVNDFEKLLMKCFFVDVLNYSCWSNLHQKDIISML